MKNDFLFAMILTDLWDSVRHGTDKSTHGGWLTEGDVLVLRQGLERAVAEPAAFEELMQFYMNAPDLRFHSSPALPGDLRDTLLSNGFAELDRDKVITMATTPEWLEDLFIWRHASDSAVVEPHDFTHEDEPLFADHHSLVRESGFFTPSCAELEYAATFKKRMAEQRNTLREEKRCSNESSILASSVIDAGWQLQCVAPRALQLLGHTNKISALRILIASEINSNFARYERYAKAIVRKIADDVYTRLCGPHSLPKDAERLFLVLIGEGIQNFHLLGEPTLANRSPMGEAILTDEALPIFIVTVNASNPGEEGFPVIQNSDAEAADEAEAMHLLHIYAARTEEEIAKLFDATVESVRSTLARGLGIKLPKQDAEARVNRVVTVEADES